MTVSARPYNGGGKTGALNSSETFHVNSMSVDFHHEGAVCVISPLTLKVLNF